MTRPETLIQPATPGEWLRSRLKENKILLAQFAGALGIDPSQLSHWLSGEEGIPPDYYVDIGNELYLDDESFRRFVALASAHNRIRGFGTAISKSLNFSEPDIIAERLQHRCISLALGDQGLYDGFELALQAHTAAALKVLRSLTRAYSRGDGQFITPSDIYLHLTYPMLHYFHFFVSEVTPADGSGGLALRDSILEFFNERCKDSRTGEAAHDMLRAHSIHMAHRLEADFDSGRLAARPGADVQERRMAMFGDAFRKPTEETTDRLIYALEHEDSLRECAFIFDAVHYGDVKVRKEWPTAVAHTPVAAARHARTIIQERRPPLNRLAKARLRLLIEHGKVPLDRPRTVADLQSVQRQLLNQNDDVQARRLLEHLDRHLPIVRKN